MKAPLVSARVGVLYAVAAGACFYLAFPPIAIGLLAPVGVLLLTTSLYHVSIRRGFTLAFLAGLIFF